MPRVLSRSRFNRRLHRIANLFLALFLSLGKHWQQLNKRSTYVLDSYPIAACDNIRILVTENGQPVEFFLAPGAMSDTATLRQYDLDVPPVAWLTGNKAYNDYMLEDVLREAGIDLLPMRKTNSYRPLPSSSAYLQVSVRKVVETTSRLFERLLTKSIHAVTVRGFELKIALFVLFVSIYSLWLQLGFNTN